MREVVESFLLPRSPGNCFVVRDPQPPAIVQLLLGSHPTTVERIGAGRAWEEGDRP